MSLRWIHESLARWDAGKARIVGGAAPGTFDSRYRTFTEATLVADDWWRVEDEGRVVGYGWLDVVWGDAEILLAVAPDAQGRGVGAFILDRLEDEARARGLGYLYNLVRPTNPRALEVSRWLEKHGFHPESDGRHLRAVKRV
jgi:ribosomal protein S18 acetylase RimI-like enzyme